MSTILHSAEPQPITQPTPGVVFNLESDEARIAFMKSQGAINLDPPLPRSTHLKNKKNGRVVPWDDMLAEHRDIMVNCDSEGNEDPNAWMQDVIPDEFDPAEKELAMIQAQSAILKHASEMADKYKVADAVNMRPQPTEYPNDAIPLDQIEMLLQKVNS